MGIPSQASGSGSTRNDTPTAGPNDFFLKHLAPLAGAFPFFSCRTTYVRIDRSIKLTLQEFYGGPSWISIWGTILDFLKGDHPGFPEGLLGTSSALWVLWPKSSSVRASSILRAMPPKAPRPTCWKHPDGNTGEHIAVKVEPVLAQVIYNGGFPEAVLE